jgi:hypothetical protein
MFALSAAPLKIPWIVFWPIVFWPKPVSPDLPLSNMAPPQVSFWIVLASMDTAGAALGQGREKKKGRVERGLREHFRHQRCRSKD